MILKKSILFCMFAVFAASVVFTNPPTKSNETPYTIMVYMNGSDLESDFGLATDDLAEMLDSGLKSENANVIILTGGTNRWVNGAIPETECVIWQLADGHLYEVESLGLANMGNPKTLSDFIIFSMQNYPAQKYGLIMWDHGGGSIAGFGQDEKFYDSALTLMDMKKAFEDAGLRENKLEFLGFDACLMATVEMAILSADYAKILIASEDVEPGDGWDYDFLSILNRNPNISGAALGRVITDTFIRFYGCNSNEILTLSVTDLSKVQPVMQAMGRLMAVAEVETQFVPLATRRANTKTFGEGSPRDNYADMVDIGDMAVQLRDMYPAETAAVLQALKNCVVYNRHNSDVPLYGLSTFYIYGGKSIGVYSLDVYAGLGMDKFYTEYLHEFFASLKEGHASPIINHELALWQPVNEDVFRLVGLNEEETQKWPLLNDQLIPMYTINATENSRFFATPAEINGVEVDIAFAKKNNTWQILGSRNRLEYVLQKGYDPILPGSKIAIYYEEWDFATDTQTWVKGEYFTVQDELQLEWATAPSDFIVMEICTDACGYQSIN